MNWSVLLLCIHENRRRFESQNGSHMALFSAPMCFCGQRRASFLFGARIWLGTILGRFSIYYFSGLGLRIRVRVWVWVRVWVRVSVGVGVRVSVVLWSG